MHSSTIKSSLRDQEYQYLFHKFNATLGTNFHLRLFFKNHANPVKQREHQDRAGSKGLPPPSSRQRNSSKASSNSLRSSDQSASSSQSRPSPQQIGAAAPPNISKPRLSDVNVAPKFSERHYCYQIKSVSDRLISMTILKF